MRSRSTVGNDPVFLGIESGGTRTVALLTDDRGNCLSRIEAGPANMRLMSDEELAHHFRTLASRLPRPSAIGIGMAGVLEPPERSKVLAAAAPAWPGIPCWAGNDLETALAASESSELAAGCARVIIISGTGSCCYGGTPSGETTRAGGWGHILGDRGSGYDISLQALRAALHQCDLTGKWPPLGQRLLSTVLVNNPNQLVTWAQSASKAEIAGLAVKVFEAAAEGDKLAQAILRDAAANLAIDAAACARRLAKSPRKVAFFLTGSALTKQPSFTSAVKRQLGKLCPGAVVKPLPREGAWGAVAYATRAWLAKRSGTTEETSAPGKTMATPPSYPLPVATGLSPTEQRNPRSAALDRLPLGRAIELMLSEDARIPGALLKERRRIEKAVRMIVKSLRAGGRLFYVGAGTSGRLGVLDASECPPTFRTSPEMVQGIMAGGVTALWTSLEGAEDDAEAGAQAARSRNLTKKDVLVGIAASGRTPFVWGALHEARAVGAGTMLVCFNPNLRINRAIAPDLVIAPNVGPEVLTGSTRLKAGTATKLLLNIFTTLSMVQLGKVVENLMVDLNPSNTKLRDRAIRIVVDLTAVDRARAEVALEKTGWVIQSALKKLGRKRRGLTSR